MKKSYIILILCTICFISNNAILAQRCNRTRKIKKKEFNAILDSANVTGSILVYDFYARAYYSNNFKHCKQGYLPASTFKIVNSIIGLETGEIENENSIFTWDGEPRRIEVWNQDLNLQDAFHYSCVPCYQELARKVGPERMNEYLTKLDYGNMVVDSSNIDKFWLEGDSEITQFEQIDFLERLYFDKLKISDETHSQITNLLFIENLEYGGLFGKTGWVIRNGNNTGWFVGYFEESDLVMFIAVNIQPNEDFNMDMFPVIRKEISLKALKIVSEDRTFVWPPID